MIFVRTLSLVALLAALVPASCTRKQNIERGVESLRHLAQPEQPGKLIGRLGDTEVRENDFLLAGTSDALTGTQLRELTPRARDIAIRQLVVRRYLVQQGLADGIFADAQAARFILPRIERILEDYYFYRKSNGAQIEAEASRLSLDDPEIKKFLAENPALQARGLNEDDVRRDSQLLIRRIVAERLRQSREAIRSELMQRNDLEVLK